MAAAIGTLAKLGIGTTSTVDQPLNFRRSSLQNRQQIINGNGLRGIYAHYLARMRPGVQDVSGQLEFEPNAQEWAYLLPWITGAAASGTTYPLTDVLTATTRFVAIDEDIKVPVYAGCVVNRATISARQAGTLGCTLDVVGTTETIGADGSFPAISINSATGPFVLTDCVASIAGTTVQMPGIDVTMDFQCDTGRYFNSLTRVSVPRYDRIVTVATDLSYGDYSALFPDGTVAGVRVLATFTNATTNTVSFIMDFKKVVFPIMSPEVRGREEVMFRMEGQALHDGTNDEVIFTLDHTV